MRDNQDATDVRFRRYPMRRDVDISFIVSFFYFYFSDPAILVVCSGLFSFLSCLVVILGGGTKGIPWVRLLVHHDYPNPSITRCCLVVAVFPP